MLNCSPNLCAIGLQKLTYSQVLMITLMMAECH